METRNMPKYFRTSGLLRRGSAVCLVMLGIIPGAKTWAGPGPARPAKLSLTVTATHDGQGETAEVEIVLRDWENKPVNAPRDLTATIAARQMSGAQQVPVVIQAGTSS